MGYENDQDSGLEEHTVNVDHIPTGNRTWRKISKEKIFPPTLPSELDDEIDDDG